MGLKVAECHPNRKMQARGMCKSCYDKWLKENNPEYRSRQKENASKWMSLRPEMRAEYNERHRARHAVRMCDPVFAETHKRDRRDRALRKKYGITIEDYEKMHAEQNGACAICSRKEGKTPLHVDHCHKTGKVRGLLCHQCNWYLGTIEADPSVLQNLLKYLER